MAGVGGVRSRRMCGGLACRRVPVIEIESVPRSTRGTRRGSMALAVHLNLVLICFQAFRYSVNSRFLSASRSRASNS